MMIEKIIGQRLYIRIFSTQSGDNSDQAVDRCLRLLLEACFDLSVVLMN